MADPILEDPVQALVARLRWREERIGGPQETAAAIIEALVAPLEKMAEYECVLCEGKVAVASHHDEPASASKARLALAKARAIASGDSPIP